MRIGSLELKKNHCYICGILNVTPDSFSDGGSYRTVDNAMRRCQYMIDEGMDILDIGGESTRPGAIKISAEEELYRVMPVLEAVKREFDIPISLDTCKGEVAAEGIRLGIDLINDVTGFRSDTGMLEVAVGCNIPICATQNNIIRDIVSDRDNMAERLMLAGISEDRLIVDPGIGFGKSHRENLLALNRLGEYCSRWPVLLGVSRKSVIGNVLGGEPNDRLEGTLALTAYAYMKGVRLIRVHDIRANRRVVDMLEAVGGEEYV